MKNQLRNPVFPDGKTRPLHSLYFRSGISKKPELLLQRVEKGGVDAILSVKDAYTLDFLDLDAKDSLSESELEQAIMDHLQEFLLEMCKGFCFEARQKRIIIDDEYYFIDLVLYNRLLHCNVIVELKVGKFRIEHAAQLNAYISYFKDCEMVDGDNPPIGILLCTEKRTENGPVCIKRHGQKSSKALVKGVRVV